MKDKPLQCLIYVSSFLIVLVFLLIMTNTTAPLLDPFEFLLWPGFLLSGFVFAEGIHSNSPRVYFALAILIDSFLWGLLLALFANYLRKVVVSSSSGQGGVRP